MSGYPDASRLSEDEAQAFEDTVLGLQVLGYRKDEAPPRAKRALEDLRKRGEKPTSETLLEEALRPAARHRTNGVG